MKIYLFYLIAMLLLCVSSRAQIEDAAQSRDQKDKKTNARPDSAVKKEPFDGAAPTSMADKCVKLITDQGDITIEFFPDSAPETVRNFLNLAALKIYDTTTFNRVVPGFIIQGGSISTRSERTPEMSERARRKIPDEPSLIKHERGIISMARGDEPNSASSNFFILLSEAPHLDGSFAAFGRVMSGIEIAQKINDMPVEGEKPKSPVQLREAVVFPCSEESSKF